MLKIDEELRKLKQTTCGPSEPISTSQFNDLCELLAKHFEEDVLYFRIGTEGVIKIANDCIRNSNTVVDRTDIRFGSILKSAREKVGLSESAMADKLYYGLHEIHEIENGNRPITPSLIDKWLAACGLPPDWKP